METLLHVGLSNAAVAAGLGLVVVVVGRYCRRPALMHSLWLLVLLKLITPPLVPVAVGWPAPPSTPAADQAAPPAPPSECPAVPEWPVAEGLELAEGWAVNPIEAVAAFPDPERAEGPRAAPAPELALAAPTIAWRLPPWRPILLGLWATGSATWLALAGLRIFGFVRLLRHARPASDELQEQAEELALRIGLLECPRVWLLPGCVSPMLWALVGAPRLLVPVELWERLDDEERASLLAHELAHLRRNDHWVRSLELIVTGLYWWHPVVWWARRAMREAEEQCCDAWVVWALPASARSYATALLQTLDFLSEARPAVPMAASGVGHLSCLKRRLTMIMQETTPRALSWAGRLAVLALAALLLPVAPTRAQRPDPGPDEPRRVADRDDDDEAPRARARDRQRADDERKRRDEDTQRPADERKRRDEDASDRDADLQKARAEVEQMAARMAEQTAKMQAEFQEAQKKLQAEMRAAEGPLRKAQAELQAAHRRLMELEQRRGGPGARGPGGPGGPGRPPGVPPGAFFEAPDAPLPPVPPVPPVAPNAPRLAGAMMRSGPGMGGPAVMESRLAELEKKLDRLADEVAKLTRSQRPRRDEDREDDEESEPRP